MQHGGSWLETVNGRVLIKDWRAERYSQYTRKRVPGRHSSTSPSARPSYASHMASVRASYGTHDLRRGKEISADPQRSSQDRKQSDPHHDLSTSKEKWREHKLFLLTRCIVPSRPFLSLPRHSFRPVPPVKLVVGSKWEATFRGARL